MEKTVLFVSHEATLTGAPVLLLNLAKWLRYNSKFKVVVLLLRDGPLRAQFEEVASVLLYEQILANTILIRVLRRIGKVTDYQAWRCRRTLQKYNISLVLSNTITNGRFISLLYLKNIPVITYVHELDYNIRMQQLFHGDITQALAQTTFFLAGSKAVRVQLLQMGVSADLIEVAYSSVPFDELTNKLTKLDVDLARVALKLPTDAQLVVAVGTANWRKGSDWFVQLASALAHRMPHLHFAWVGVSSGTVEHMQMSHDLTRFGIVERFHMVPVTPDYLTYIALADVFVLSSREDPFPLVVLEAAAASKPIVCFADAGGAPEFVGVDNGIVVPYGDINALADAVLALLQDEESRRTKGKHAQELVRRYHDIPVVAKRIREVLIQYAQ